MSVSDAVGARPAERNLWGDCILPVLAGFVPIVAVSSAQGGYFPTAWGWSTLGLTLAATGVLFAIGPRNAGVLLLIVLLAYIPHSPSAWGRYSGC